jgi:hypothetical protein
VQFRERNGSIFCHLLGYWKVESPLESRTNPMKRDIGESLLTCIIFFGNQVAANERRAEVLIFTVISLLSEKYEKNIV